LGFNILWNITCKICLCKRFRHLLYLPAINFLIIHQSHIISYHHLSSLFTFHLPRVSFKHPYCRYYHQYLLLSLTQSVQFIYFLFSFFLCCFPIFHLLKLASFSCSLVYVVFSFLFIFTTLCAFVPKGVCMSASVCKVATLSI